MKKGNENIEVQNKKIGRKGRKEEEKRKSKNGGMKKQGRKERG